MAPVRRASAAGHTTGGPPGRVHRSNGSSHSVAAQTPPTTAHGSPYSGTSGGTTSTPQQKIVYVLVNRLKNKLPCYSGITLPDLENDDAVQQSVESLVDISRDSLDIVAWALTELVDKLQRNTDSSGYRAIDVLQSQLFVLKLLSIAMAARWSRRSDSLQQGPNMSSRTTDSPNGSAARLGRSRQASAEQLAALSQWIEPPALDENCARYILSVMVVFLRQAAPGQQRLVSAANINFDASYHDLESIESIDYSTYMDIFHSGPQTAPSIGSYYANVEARGRSSWRNPEPADAQSVRTARHFPQHTISYERTSAVISGSMTALHTLIAKFAGRVVYHLSASNWGVVFSRIKNNIYTLASTADDEPDIADVRLMTYCWLDRVRLVQLLQELSSLLVNMQRGAQTAICAPLRIAIWNWIEYHSEEFNDALLHHRRLEGAPERVFDILYSLIEVHNKAAVWPALTALMCISSDRIQTDYQVNSIGVPRGPHGRKDRNFAEILLRTLVNPGKVSEVPIVCALDVCRAASRVKPSDNDVELPLQAMATDVAHEVKMILIKWDGLQKPFWESPDEIDVGLVADALVTTFRFMGEEDSIPLIRQALQPEMSEAVKISAIKACITLVMESTRLPWQRSLHNLKAECTSRLYGIFHSSISRRAEYDATGVLKKPAYRPKAKRYTAETLPDRELALHAILALWRADVRWFIDGLDPSHEDQWIPKTLILWHSPVDYSVRLALSRIVLYIQDGLRAMSPDLKQYKTGLNWITHCAAGTMAAFGMNLLNCRTDFEAQRMWMHMSHELLYRFTRSVAKIQDTKIPEDWAAAFGLVEIAFLVTLTSADRIVSATASTCLRLIAIAERQKGSTPMHLLSEEEKSKRYPVYEQLGAPKALVLGRVADQKRIRKLLRLIALPTPSNVAVWEECYWRWVGLNIMAQRTSMDPSSEDGPRPHGDRSLSPEERQAQWQNLTLFLASFSAACLRESHDPSALAAIIPARYLPDQMRVLRDPTDMLGQFLRSIVDLLISTSVQARDVAREALSTEAHPRLYPRILKQLDEVLLGMTGSSESGIAWDDVALFLEQFTSILKVIIENVQSSEDFRGIDIMSILQRVALWITKFHDATSFRLKIKFCALCDSFMDHPELLAIRRDNAARLAITDCIIEWAQELTGTRDSEQIRAQREINTATLRTAVRLFDRLQLQTVGEDGQPMSGEEAGHTTARFFIRYSSFLFKMFNRTENGDDCLSEQTTFSQSRTGAKDGDLRELVINGLASLISANPEYGVKHCLPMTFEPDPAMRVVFAHVFARVVGRGLKFETPDIQPPTNKQSKLCELVKASDPALALAICEVCPPGEVDQIINVLLNMFDTRSSLMSLLKAMIDKEIARTDSDTALFRSNSTCTRFLSAFAKIYGYSYLRDLIVPLIKTMTSLPQGHCYDLDPTKAVNQDFAQNQRDLEFVAASFLEIITASVPAFPSMFREICAHIGKAVNDVWPEAKFSALGAFIFLRFISPAIVNPALVDVEVPADPVMRRGLMNIAKIMQNLANNIFFGKEIHMVPLNDFLSANIVNVTRFLSEINKYTPPDDEQEEWLDTAYDDTDNIVLHRFFERHADKVGKELLSASSKPADETDDEKGTGSGKRSWNAICNALVENTQASLIPTLSTLTSREHPEYLDLMSRYGHRDTSSVEHLFVPALTPKDHPAVFVLAVTKIDVEALDLELLLCYILKTLTSSTYENKKFDIIFDWTGFAQGAQIPTHWIKFACEIIPVDIRQRFWTSRMLSPNALALRYMRRLYNLTNGATLSTKFAMHVTTSDLLRNYPEGTSIPSLTYAMELEDEVAVEFDEVFMRHNHPMRVPVIMRVAQTHVRITMMKATNINNSSSCRATEIVSLADISDVYNVSTGHDANEFIIRKIRHGTTLYFTSSARDNIVKTIRNAKGSMRNVQIPGFERFSKLSSVIATLLHIGMVNIGDNNEELRVASYELLCSICTFLDFEGKPVVPTKTAFVPGRAGPFVTQLSEKLALFAPQLTLDFLTEVAAGMDKAPACQRIACLQYMSPWIRNLGCFTNPTHHLYEPSGAKFRDCVRVLIDLTLADQEIHAVIQKYVWAEIGRLESEPVNVILDELMRAAVDGGIGSQRCEIVADTMSSLSSINVRARIAARIRKVLGKTSSRPSKSLADNIHWNEIACLTRLCLVANYLPRNGTHAQLFVAEGAHYISLVAGTGQLLVRTSVYGMVVNQLHSVYMARPSGEGTTLSPEIQELLDECARNETLMVFGLFKPTPTSDYVIYDPPNEKQYLDNLEKLGHLLMRIMQAISGSQALLNIWRARWMSLITSSAFQTCPAIQTRAFISLSLLARTEVDDDLLYQILVALKSALESYDDSDTTSVVSMLRCICKVTPGLPVRSRYLVQLFWLAVALLQSSSSAVYIEAVQLVRISVETLAEQGAFKEKGVAATLLEGRIPLEEIACQIDQLLGLSFESSFSFCLAAIIFRGLRQPALKEHAETALRSLLRVVVQSCPDHDHVDAAPEIPICADALGFFIALLPVSTTSVAFRQLLEEVHVNPAWYADEDIMALEDDDPISRVPFTLLGITDEIVALYATSFISSIISTAQGNDREAEVIYTLLSDIAYSFPDTIVSSFDCLQDQIKDAFANTSNPNTLNAVSNVFRVAMQDSRRGGIPRGSMSTLSTVEETNGNAGHRGHNGTLDDLGMRGLTSGFQFAGPTHSIKIIKWIGTLVMRMIEG